METRSEVPRTRSDEEVPRTRSYEEAPRTRSYEEARRIHISCFNPQYNDWAPHYEQLLSPSLWYLDLQLLSPSLWYLDLQLLSPSLWYLDLQLLSPSLWYLDLQLLSPSLWYLDLQLLSPSLWYLDLQLEKELRSLEAGGLSTREAEENIPQYILNSQRKDQDPENPDFIPGTEVGKELDCDHVTFLDLK
uniref:Uncharacterized protein n=1 Tax=Knipowitschia caucasica TaxID=637954 RepID=A0AAV2J5G3_KNICA